MTYDELRKQSNRGWNTWFTSSMTAHVLLPYGFSIGLGFKRPSEEEARLLSTSSEKIFLCEWKAHGHVHENYSGIDGSGCGVDRSCPFYHWGGLMGYIAIEGNARLALWRKYE